MTKEEIYKTLDELNIKYRIINHKAVFTMEEVIKENIEPYENILKNIFIRDDKKRNYYLVLVCHNKKVNLKELSNKINSRKLSFADEEDLYNYLGLTKGSVSPLGILNDKAHKVTILIDKDIENGLDMASKFFFKGNYKKSLETAIAAINIIEPDIHKKMLNLYKDE